MDRQEQLLGEIKDLLKRGGGPTAGSSGGGFDNVFKGIGGSLGTSLENLSNKFNPLTAGVSLASAAFTEVKGLYSQLDSVLQPNLGTWRKLSTTGQNFDGSIVEMAASAKRAGVTLEELAEFGQRNAGKFNNLTSEIGNGLQEFTKLSQGMVDSGVAAKLKRLGYDTGEYNEVLALSLRNFSNFSAAQETTTGKTLGRNELAIAAADKLAVEFDSLAKLTGKNRKDMAEQYAKQQLDGQAEAKLRLLTAGKSEDEAREIRAEYQKLRLQAELQGQEALFKEQFAFGSVKSREAKAQLVMTGDAGQNLADSATRLANGQVKEAEEAMTRSRIAMRNLMDDKQFLSIAVLTQDNQYAKFNADLVTKNMAYRDASMAVEEDMRKKGLLASKNKAEVEELVFKEVIARSTKLPDKPTAASTATVLNLETASQNVARVFMDDVVKPINEKVAPSLTKFNDGLNLLSGQVLVDGKILSARQAASEELQKIYNTKTDTKTGTSTTKEGNAVANNPQGPTTYIGQDALRGVGAAVKGLLDAIEKVAPEGKRATGSPGINDFLSGGSFKNMFENFGSGTNMQLDGREIVATESQVSALMAKAQSSVTNMLGNGGGQNQDEFLAVLKQISTNMKQMVTYTASVADHAQRQVRATKNLSNNMYEA